jgi:hypothetical protein
MNSLCHQKNRKNFSPVDLLSPNDVLTVAKTNQGVFKKALLNGGRKGKSEVKGGKRFFGN